jgi:hypothetical protein
VKNAAHHLITGASILAAAAGAVSISSTPSAADSYMAGDFHNHTPCSDGRSSVETLVKKSIETYGLEWLGAADHGGSSPRDCRVDDPEGNGSNNNTAGKFFDEARDGLPAVTIKGNVATSSGHRSMWRWQSTEEIVYPELVRLAREMQSPMLYAGVETNVPGHEHVSMTVIGNQRPQNYNGDTGDASGLAEFEYRFDRSDTDTSRGVESGHNWEGKIANATGAGSGTINHNQKAIPSVRWLQNNYPLDSYYVPAHTERAGVFDPNGNRGFNVEHFRNFNNAGPTVAVGFETQPGHQASNNRGEYRAGFCGTNCDSVGVTTFGGTGIYGAKIGGVWDAMLGEGRNWYFYASSDWHNRGAFSIYETATTADFYPGEYQKLFVPRPAAGQPMRPQVVVDGVRSGNSFSTMGDLITGELTYKAEVVGYAAAGVAKMGQTLVVPRGRTVRLTLEVNLPTGPNHSPYTFNNPSLAQIGIQEPLNRPTLRHVDFIRGNVTGPIAPTSPNYTNGTNPSASVLATFNQGNWQVNGNKRTMVVTIPGVQTSQYIRVRGSNLPPGTPFETDAQGNPLNDWDPENLAQGPVVPCLDAACPPHMFVRNGQKVSSYDVAGWADLWFYTNPIFIRVAGQP